MKGDYLKKTRPKTARTLVQALNKGQQLDGRTNIAKSIRECRAAIQDSLSEAARALLEHDASTAAVVQTLALKQAFSNPNQVINSEGKAHFALNTWSKYAQLKRSSLLALKKFQKSDEPEAKPQSLGDLILETEAEPDQHETDDDVADAKADVETTA